MAAAAAVLIGYFLVVRTGWGQRLDEYAFMGRDVISDLRAAQADSFLRIVSIGSLALVTILIAALAFAQRRPRLALLAAGSIAMALLSTEILKHVLLERPPLVASLIVDNSYPSGHSTVGMAVGVAAMLVVPPRLRTATALGAALVGAAFGVAVVAAGWHRPSDVVGAYLVVLAAGSAAAALARMYPDAERPSVHASRWVPTGLRIGATEFGLIAIGLLLMAIFGLTALTVRGIPWTSAGAGFLASSAALVVAAFLTTALLASAMNAADREGARSVSGPG